MSEKKARDYVRIMAVKVSAAWLQPLKYFNWVLGAHEPVHRARTAASVAAPVPFPTFHGVVISSGVATSWGLQAEQSAEPRVAPMAQPLAGR